MALLYGSWVTRCFIVGAERCGRRVWKIDLFPRPSITNVRSNSIDGWRGGWIWAIVHAGKTTSGNAWFRRFNGRLRRALTGDEFR